MGKFFICCWPLTFGGMFKAIASADLFLSVILIAATGASFKYEFHLNSLLYLVLTVIYFFFVFSALRIYYTKYRPNTKYQRCYAVTRLVLLIGSLFASYNTYYKSYMLLDNYEGPNKMKCMIFFATFSLVLVIYFIYNIHWSINLLQVTFGKRSGDEDEDSEELLE